MKLLKLLRSRKKARASQLAKELGLEPAAVARLAYSLSLKGLVRLEKVERQRVVLTPEGRRVKKEGLPEKLLVAGLPKKVEDVDRIALNWALKRKWVELKGGKVVAIARKLPRTEEEAALEGKIEPGSREFKLLRKRKWVELKKSVDYVIELTEEGSKAKLEEEVTQVTPELLKGGAWRKKKLLPFSPDTPVPRPLPGRVHPLTEIIDKIRRVFLDMGFIEAEGPHVESAFWDFDALFVPQDHPAREMQDTFYLDGEAPLPELASRVSEMHKKTWKKWDPKESARRLLRTHTTSVSAHMLAELTPPAKIFTIGKVFRNEAVDYKHLAEFYQVEGIVVDEAASFNNLIGYLKEFFSKLGFDRVRMRPAYFPYTEFSAEVDVWFEPRAKWLELGGAGIFRPEVVVPLLGKDIPVLAWGLGLARIAMLKYSLDDVRKLYLSDIGWLREREVFM